MCVFFVFSMNQNNFLKIALFLLLVLPTGVFASTLSGGSFLVNGGFTSISSSSTGGTFILNNSGDSITPGNITGGSLVASPAFAPLGSSPSTGGGNNGGGNNDVGGGGGSYSPPPRNGNNIPPVVNSDIIQNKPIQDIKNNEKINTVLGNIFNVEKNTCTYIKIKNPIGIDTKNDPELVKKIEIFLDRYEHASLVVNSFYGTDDKKAVENFQNKYALEILRPWGYIHPTGVVYITTVAKINAIACNTNPALTEISDKKVDLHTKIQILEKKAENFLYRIIEKIIHFDFFTRVKIFLKNILHY